VREVIETCRKITGGEIKAVEGPRRPGDPPVLVADPTRAREELGWEPKFRALEEIAQTAWEWKRRRYRT